MSKKFKSEAEFASIVVEWLIASGWEVYQEVKHRDMRCDIYAIKSPVSWAIETKLSFGFAVLGQAYQWRKHSNYVSVAVPFFYDNTSERYFKKLVCEKFGVGVLALNYRNEVVERVRPAMNRRIYRPLLFEKQKNFSQAGNNQNDFYSPWRGTMDKIINYIERYPGVTIREILNDIETHYSSPTSARNAISRDIVLGVGEYGERIMAKKEDGKLYFYPKNKEAMEVV